MAVADMLKALQIKANIIADKSIGLMEISTEVHDGIAVLIGEVETEEQKRIAEELAYEIDGIYEVQNEIEVIPRSDELQAHEKTNDHIGYGFAEGDAGDTTFGISGEETPPGPGFPASEQFPGEYTDEQIEEEVRSKLDSQNEIDTTNVQIHSINQVVHLKGNVKTTSDLYRLQDMVMNVRGVMGVDSELSVTEGDTGTPMI